MSKLSKAAIAYLLQTRSSILREFPGLRAPRPVAAIDRDAVVLGRDSMGKPVTIPVRARLEHMHVVGTTGGGKTRIIQHLACQDINQGRGVCILDPHGSHSGSLYRSMLTWLSNQPHLVGRTIHIIDPNTGTHVTGFNPLALPDESYEPPVVAEAMQQALERVWGEEDLNAKPTLQRVLAAILTTLSELNLTLAEARLFFDPDDRHGVRAWAMHSLNDEDAREELEWLHAIASDTRSQQDFRQEVTGPRNRLGKLTKNEAVKLTVSQDVNAIDFRAALDEGHIILANLSPGPRAGDQSMQLLGKLLTRSIFFHTVRRIYPERAFFLYLDECQLYLSGDVSRMLAETRKFGTGVILSHQTLAQLRAAGEDMLDAVKSTTNIKIITRLKDPTEAAELADMVFRHDLERSVASLVKPTVVGHRVVRRYSEGVSDQRSVGESLAETIGESETQGASRTRSESFGESESQGISTGQTHGMSESLSSSTSETGGRGRSTAINFVPGDIDSLPPSASGNTLGESAATFSSMRSASPTRYLVGEARFEPAIVSGLGVGQSEQSGWGRSNGRQSGQNSSISNSTSTQRGTSHSTSEAFTESAAYTTSHSSTRGTSKGHSTGTSRGWSESLEPILAERPTSVHSLTNMRYAASEILRCFPAGRVAVSFVDADGMKREIVQVARVDDCDLTPEQFIEVREQMLDASPSAVPIEEARARLIARQNALKKRAEGLQSGEPQAPAKFRSKRPRPKNAESAVDEHGEPSPSESPPVKGPDRRRRRP